MKPFRIRSHCLAALGALLSATAVLIAPAPAFALTASVALSGLPSNPTMSTSASIKYTLSGSGTVYCRRDSYAPVACTNPFNLGQATPLSNGTHTVNYYIDTGSGINTASPAASYTWQVVAPPTVRLSNLPSNPTTQTSASISYTLSGTGTVYCRRDGYDPIACPNPFQLGQTTALAAGTHTVDYFVDIGSGINTASPAASYTWQVNSTTTTTSGTQLSFAPTKYVETGFNTGTNPVYGTDGILRFGAVADPADSTKTANLHRVKQGDPKWWNGYRSEITYMDSTYDISPGKDYWMAFAIRPKGGSWPTSGMPYDQQVVWQVHQRSDASDADDCPELSLQLNGDGTAHWIVCTSPLATSAAATDQHLDVYHEPFQVDQWAKYVVHYRPGYVSSFAPKLEVWRNGTLLFTYTGVSGFNNVNPSWPKMGIYQWGDYWNPSERVMYTKGMWFGVGTDGLASALSFLQ